MYFKCLNSARSFLLVALVVALSASQARAAHQVLFGPTGIMGVNAAAEGISPGCYPMSGTCTRSFSLYDTGEISGLADQLRAETAGVRSDLSGQVASVRTDFASHQQQVGQTMATQAKTVDDRVTNFEKAIFQSLSNFDQRILNQEAINVLREEMKKTIREEVARQTQLIKSGQ